MEDQKTQLTRKVFMFTPEHAKKLDDYRFERRHKTEVDALRELLDIAFQELKFRGEKLR
jgi:hypothetical protein